MSPLQHAELGYAVATILLWGYALWVWIAGRAAARKRKHRSEVSS